MGLFSSVGDYLGGCVADPLLRTITVDSREIEIRKAEHGTPYTNIIYKNQTTSLRGDFLLDFSDENLISRIREEIAILKLKEEKYQESLSNDVALLRQICASVGIQVDEDIQGNFKYFLHKYLKAKGNGDIDFYIAKGNGDSYEVIYEGFHSLKDFLILLDKKQEKQKELEQLRKAGKPIPRHLR